MLRLCRLRFDSIGAPDVRLAPLELDFTRGGGAADSLLWMRNGGGKTAILSLFFALLRPDRREFLGALTEAYGTQTRRRLADHVQASDTAHVVAEWELAGVQASLLGDAPERLVTGMLLEWTGRARSSDETRLKRGFYAFRTGRGLDFESLPVTTSEEGEIRRSGYGRYRELLLEASRHSPGMELIFTESQREWGTHLERVGLDPDLARYQLDMNRREGAAHELFRFRDDAEFVEFFLKMVVSPEGADGVAETLGSYAVELAKRPKLELEWAFLDAVLEAMRELAERAAARTAAQGQLREAWQDTARLCAELRAGAATRRSLAEQRQREAAAHEALANEVRRRSEELASQAQAVRLRGAELAHEASVRALEEAEQAERAADELHRAWQAAELLCEFRALEAAVATLDEQLAREQDEVAPLLAELATLGDQLLRRLAEQQRDLEHKREEAQRALRDAEELRKRSAAKRERCLESRTRCEEKRAQIEQQERVLAAEEASLRREALLGPDEGASEAEVRLEQEAQALEFARQTRDGRLAQIREERRATEQGRLRATSDKMERDGGREQLSARLSELREQFQGLREEALLAELAETVDFDLLALGPSFVKRLREADARDEGALMRLEIEGFEDRRALEALEQDGLLPPSRDAERVLEHLATAGIPAAPGWRYLAESVSDERRRSVLEQHPELAAGIVITQADRLPEARALLVGGDLLLDAALVVATAAGVQGASPEPSSPDEEVRFVLAPRAALFDLDAAGEEREARAVSVASLEQRRAVLRQRMNAQDELRRRLESLLGDCPAGHLEALDAELDGLDNRIATLARELIELGERAEALDEEAAALREDERRDQQRGAEITRALERLAGFAKQAAGVSRLQETRPALEAEYDSALQGLQEAELQEEAAATQRATEETLAREVAGALFPVQQQQQEIRRDGFLAADRGEGAADAGAEAEADALAETREESGDTSAQWSRYEICRDQYKRASSNDVLRSRRDESAAQLAGVNEKLGTAKLAGLHGAATGLLREPAAAEPVWRRSQLERADLRRTEAIAHAGKVCGEEKRLSEEVDRLQAEVTVRGPLPEDLQPEDAAAARVIAERLDAEVASANEERSRARSAAQDAANDARLLEQEAQGFDAQEKRLASALDAQADRLEAATPESEEAGAEPPASPFGGDLQEAQHVVDARDEALRRRAREYEQADRAVRKGAEALQKVARAPAYAELASVVRERIAMDEPEHLSETTEQQCGEIEMRVDEIIKHIESLDAHRDLIVQAIAGIVEDALDLLQGAERSSKLPAELDAWANRHFLQIRFERPHRDEELFGRLAGLVDRIVDEGSVPRGLSLLLRASLEVVGATGYKVTILKPDALLRTERFSIAEMGKFSAGQQLTGAILLYCTLARLRAKNRGRSAAEGGLLILDNPIGTCSNVTMLRLQRRVAEAMGIQLVFTTGVNDLDALATLPNIIRLRNDQRDRRSGHLHVTADEAPEKRAGVTATRVYRREPAAP